MCHQGLARQCTSVVPSGLSPSVHLSASALCFRVRQATFAGHPSLSHSLDAQGPSLVIFQFLEESNFMLWCNWIAVAVAFQVFEEGTTGLSRVDYHLSCMGTPALNERVKLYYAGGCDSFRNATAASTRRIYFSKWWVNASAAGLTSLRSRLWRDF